MLFKDQLSFIFQHLKKNKLRLTMTTLATTIGCAFLIVLASIGFGVQETVENEILNQESVTEIQLWGEEKLTPEQKTEIEGIEHVNTILEQERLSETLLTSIDDRQAHSPARILDMSAMAKLPSNLAEGRLPTAANEIFVGYHFAQSLLNDADRKLVEEKSKEAEEQGTWYDGSEEGYKESLIGKTVTLQFTLDGEEQPAKTQEFTIVGVKKQPSYEWATDSEVYLHEDVQTIISENGIASYSEQKIYVDSTINVMPVLDILKEKNYQVYSVMEQLEEMEIFFLVFKIGLIFIGTIAVLIASIGIFNTMTMAVTERTREIGILKAIGASPSLIQRLFLMESLFIGVIGTALAVAISYSISYLANALLPIVLEIALDDADFGNMEIIFSAIPLSLVLIASFISLFVAVLSGWRPAKKATKIQVIQALQQL